MTKRVLVLLSVIVIVVSVSFADVGITKIEPTPFFPKVNQGEPLKQVARLSVNTAGEPDSSVRITIAGNKPYTQALGALKPGADVKDIHILDIDKPSKVTIDLLASDGRSPAPWKSADWTILADLR